MRPWTTVVCAILWGTVVLVSASHAEALPHAGTTETGAATITPWGWADLCGRHLEECQVDVMKAETLHLTSQRWSTLKTINDRVNGEIALVSDEDHWGSKVEHWDYPVDGKGESKIYAIWKRKLLRDLGFPRQCLLLTMLHDTEGRRHVVLTVKTDRGEFILDNATSQIRDLADTPYQPVKRQTQTDPNSWVILGTRPPPSAGFDGTPVPLVSGLTWGMSKEEALKAGFDLLPATSDHDQSYVGKASIKVGGFDMRLRLDFDQEAPPDYRGHHGLNYIHLERRDCEDRDIESLSHFLATRFVDEGVKPNHGNEMILNAYSDPQRKGTLVLVNRCYAIIGLNLTIRRDKSQ